MRIPEESIRKTVSKFSSAIDIIISNGLDKHLGTGMWNAHSIVGRVTEVKFVGSDRSVFCVDDTPFLEIEWRSPTQTLDTLHVGFMYRYIQ